MSLLLIPVVVSSCYLLMVSLCICDRMTSKTSHFTRAMVVVIGGLAAWALAKTIMTGWHDSPVEILQAAMITVIAIILATMPRIEVCPEQKKARNNQKVRQGR